MKTIYLINKSLIQVSKYYFGKRFIFPINYKIVNLNQINVIVKLLRN